MIATVEGVYREGRVELNERPDGVGQSRVLVIFLPDERAKPEPRYLQYGRYAGELAASDEDFASAEWRGGADVD